VGASNDDLEWLSPLVDARLAERFDNVPRVAHDAAVQAEAEHLRKRPHDREGADLLAELAAHDALIEHLSTAYMDVLDWAVGLLQERRESAHPHRRHLRRRSGGQADVQATCEVPKRILDGLTLQSERPGWLDGRAA